LSFNDIQLGNGQLYVNVFPVAWKVYYLTANNDVSRTFTPTYSVLLCELENGNIVRSRDARNNVPLGKNYNALNENGFNVLKDPSTDGTPNAISITNIGNQYISAAIGDGNKNPMMVQKDLMGNEAAVFIPKLTLYVYLTRNYKENEVIKSEIQGPKLQIDTPKFGSEINIEIVEDNGQVIIRLMS